MSGEVKFCPLRAPHSGWLRNVQLGVAGCNNDLEFLSEAMSRAAASTTQTPAAKESALGFAERLTKLHTVAKDASASAYKFTETGNGFIFMLEPTEVTRAYVAALPHPVDVASLWACACDALRAMKNITLPVALKMLSAIEEEAGASPVVENGTLGEYKESVQRILTEMQQLFLDLDQDV